MTTSRYRQLMTHAVEVIRRGEDHVWLVLRRPAARHTQKPITLKLEHCRRTAILPVQGCAQDIRVELSRPTDIGHHK